MKKQRINKTEIDTYVSNNIKFLLATIGMNNPGVPEHYKLDIYHLYDHVGKSMTKYYICHTFSWNFLYRAVDKAMLDNGLLTPFEEAKRYKLTSINLRGLDAMPVIDK